MFYLVRNQPLMNNSLSIKIWVFFRKWLTSSITNNPTKNQTIVQMEKKNVYQSNREWTENLNMAIDIKIVNCVNNKAQVLNQKTLYMTVI